MLTEEQIQEAALLIATEFGNEDDATEVEHYAEYVVPTRDTVEQFKANLRFNRSRTDGKLTVLINAQRFKGDERQDVYIVDFGDVRAVYK